MYIFQKRYEELCRAQGLSTLTAADHAGILPSAVKSWEKYGNPPFPTDLKCVMDFFGVPRQFLLGVEPFWEYVWDAIQADPDTFLKQLQTACPDADIGGKGEALPLGDLIRLIDKYCARISCNASGIFHITPKKG